MEISVFGRSFDEGEEAAKMIEDQGEKTQILEAFKNTAQFDAQTRCLIFKHRNKLLTKLRITLSQKNSFVNSIVNIFIVLTKMSNVELNFNCVVF